MNENWLSYFWCGGIALALSWALSGCRLGNHEVDAPSKYINYETRLSSINICATVPGVNSGQPTCATKTSLNFLPGLPQNFPLLTLPDPLTFVVLDGSPPAFGIYSTDGRTPYFVLEHDNQQNLTFPVGSATLPIFTDSSTGDPTCTLALTLQMAGNYTTTGPFSTHSSLPMAGRMNLQMELAYAPQGQGCTKAIQCAYTDTTQCDGNDRPTIINYFQPFTDSGVVTSSAQLPSATLLSYTIQYQ